MSLDVYLTIKSENISSEPQEKIYIREDGMNKEITRKEWNERFPDREPFTVTMQVEENDGETEVFHANITHNLGTMAANAGIYKCLWRPDENGISIASELINPLTAGLQRLQDNPEKFKQFNPSNGWGTYEGLISFIEDYLAACKEYPEAKIEVWK